MEERREKRAAGKWGYKNRIRIIFFIPAFVGLIKIIIYLVNGRSLSYVAYMMSSPREFFLEMLSNNSTVTSSLGFTDEREDLSVAVSACQSY